MQAVLQGCPVLKSADGQVRRIFQPDTPRRASEAEHLTSSVGKYLAN
jgi:hypothetical protein